MSKAGNEVQSSIDSKNVLLMYIFTDELCSVQNVLSVVVEDDLSKVEDVLVAIEDTL